MRLHEVVDTLHTARDNVSSTGENMSVFMRQKVISSTNLTVATDEVQQRERVLQLAAPRRVSSFPVATGGAMREGESW